ncbi:unnamed protein product [Cuscuta europaea]|uniref:Vacuolar protein sorting-associated protein 62 n=1 Tax=Cuscuta europaea TaxID=41803 RepID=A0A9P0ZCV3_CUSEU|nr:unnamed protein product [Cuscuta europaea]
MAFTSGRPFLFKSILFAWVVFFPSSFPMQIDHLEDSPITVGNISSINTSSYDFDSSFKVSLPPAILQGFTYPAPLPQWKTVPEGAFGSGAIDLGGLVVSQTRNLTQVWNTSKGNGATFFEPSSLPEGFFILGSYAQANNVPLFGGVLVGKDVTGRSLRKPTDYALFWCSQNSTKTGLDTTQPVYFWVPNCTTGYAAVGFLVTNTSSKPPLGKIRCVLSNFTDASVTAGDPIWSVHGVSISTAIPQERGGVQARALAMCSFMIQASSTNLSSLPPTPACLRNTNQNFSSAAMPNKTQIQTLMEAYGPLFYFHPDEKFLPSSVEWFFQNGALLVWKNGSSEAGVPVLLNGSNLPLNGTGYWLDLPANATEKQRVKRGDVQNATAYVHVKSMFGGTFTDMAVWVFYPFNGPAFLKVGPETITLETIGEHTGDWEHVTLRINNFDGALESVFFSQHAGGVWVKAPQLEFLNATNKPVVYASLHGHAAYPEKGENLLGSGLVKIKNSAAIGNVSMDTGLNFTLVSAECLGEDAVVEPNWLNSSLAWGPTITYGIAKELKPFRQNLPPEVTHEQGPCSPKLKESWSGDEMCWNH